jgi:hypothetical protein
MLIYLPSFLSHAMEVWMSQLIEGRETLMGLPRDVDLSLKCSQEYLLPTPQRRDRVHQSITLDNLHSSSNYTYRL